MSFPNPDLNPCTCNKCLCFPPDPCPTSPECCLRACSFIIPCTDAMGPCGIEGTFDLATLDHTVTGCTGSLTYVLEEYDSNFPYVAISPVGILTWRTPGPEFVNEHLEVCFRIVCETDCLDCSKLESLGYGLIGIKDLCQGSACVPGEVCDPCTGDCEVVATDTEVNSSDSLIDTSVTS